MKKTLRISAVILLLAGITIIIYPYASQYINEKKMQKLIVAFDDIKNSYQKDILNELITEEDSDYENAKYLKQMYSDMQKYNQTIYLNNQSGLTDTASYKKSALNLFDYGVKSEIAGYIEIPSIAVVLPIYLGATDKNMTLGAVHLCETSLPIGGINTNCVLAAHRRYSASKMFRNIEEIKIDDSVYITNFWEKLTYRVVETKIIADNDIKEILIKPGKDMLTFFSCHPYSYSYQRYVVYCERVETE